MFKIKKLLLLWLLFGHLIAEAQCPTGTTTFTVTNNSGSNITGSLARACQCVNTMPIFTTIVFAIPSGSLQIQPTSELLISDNGILVDGNSQNGIIIDGSSVLGAPAHGLRLSGTGNTVRGLRIRNFTATAGGHGIRLDANTNTLTGNTLHNNRNGVFTTTPVSTALITQNSIYCNTVEGISRSLGPAIPTIVANTQRVRGTAAANAVVEIYINDPAGCAAAPCQGKTLVGTVTANAAGVWQLNLTPGALNAGQQVTATSTLNGNNTSEFSTCATVANCAAFDVNVADTDVSCFGGANGAATATATGGSPIAGVSFLWSTGATTAMISSLAPNVYTVTATDAAGCTATEIATIAQPTALTSSFTTQNISCFGGSNGALTASPAGGTPGYNYAWSNGQNGMTINNLAAGNYTVTVRDNNGCSVTGSTQLIQPVLLSTSLTSQNISCFGGANGGLTAVPAGGTPGYNYLWSSGQSTVTINNLTAGNYTVTVTDLNGCTATSSTQLTQPAQITLSVNATNESAMGANDGSASAMPGGGTPGYNYLWSNGAVTAQIGNLAPGAYTVTVTDINGCTRSATATVSSGQGGGGCSALPVYAVLVPSQVCGNTTLSLEVDDLYPSPAVRYVWFFPNGDSAITVQPMLDLLVTSTDFSGEYFVLRDSAGCRSIAVGGAPVTVLSLDPAQVFAGTDSLLCAAGVVVLKAQLPPQGTGAWVSLGAATVDSPANAMTAARNLQTGANGFVWQVSLGTCTAAASDTVVFFLEQKALLNDDRYTLQRAQDIAVMEVLLNDALAGLADTVVTQLGTPSVGLLEYLEEGRRFRYTVDEDFRGTVQFQYTVCSPASACNFPCDTATVTIDIQNLPVVPEALVVDDPGPNGQLTIRGITGFSRVEIAVFNRWGDLVFQEKNYRNDAPWLGQFSGKNLPGGAYYYYLQAWDGNMLIGGTQTGVIHLFEQE